jgi:hypothetical protein
VIADLDRSIERLLETEFTSPLPFGLSFAAPDRSFVPPTAHPVTLNCYLFEIREDRELRRVAPSVRVTPGGTIERTPPPLRVQASYCLTAWSRAVVSTGGTPQLDEHHLLSQVLRALSRHATLPPAVLTGLLLGQEPPLPTSVISPGGAATGSDFWNAIGGTLRPSLDYTLTFALAYRDAISGPMVTTRVSRYGSTPGFERPDEWIQIGGVVTAAGAFNPVPNAWVLLDDGLGRAAIADAAGRFTFERVRAGNWMLRARASGFQDGSRPVTVPEPTGDYTVTLTAI